MHFECYACMLTVTSLTNIVIPTFGYYCLLILYHHISFCLSRNCICDKKMTYSKGEKKLYFMFWRSWEMKEAVIIKLNHRKTDIVLEGKSLVNCQALTYMKEPFFQQGSSQSVSHLSGGRGFKISKNSVSSYFKDPLYCNPISISILSGLYWSGCYMYQIR